MKNLFFVIISIHWLFGCQSQPAVTANKQVFADSPFSIALVAGILDEASGLADSKANPGFLWVEQDSGNPPDIALLEHNGTFKKKINIKDATNRDWEEMALSKGPDPLLNYLYVADFGDNAVIYNSYTIYRFPEPSATIDTVFNWQKIEFKYPDGSHNAEAFLVDESSKDIYIFTKNDAKVKIFKLVYPQNTAALSTAVQVGELSFNEAVGAAISPDSREIIIKTYAALYYWKRDAGESIETALKKVPVMLPYKREIQGEAVCFRNDNTGFFTISERPMLVNFVELNFYKRN